MPVHNLVVCSALAIKRISDCSVIKVMLVLDLAEFAHPVSVQESIHSCGFVLLIKYVTRHAKIDHVNANSKISFLYKLVLHTLNVQWVSQPFNLDQQSYELFD